MKLNLDELHHRIRTDYSFKKRLRKIVVIGGIGILFLGILAIIGIIFFSSAIISFIFANVPGLFELGFNFFRDFAGSFMLQDITAILTPLAGGTNVSELQNLVTQYFNQLSSNPNIDFQNFQNFITTVKNSVLDNQITNTELELVKQFLLN
ncbi:hypothetical protein [Ignavibacterium sp.]|uniref:hypothetical protein n=1 Tax=Ignavibacterium sp. TaxID=2651167 RepID=UPI00307FB501